MPLAGTKTVWATAIVAAIKAANPETNGQFESQLLTFWEIVAGEHLTHLTVTTSTPSNLVFDAHSLGAAGIGRLT